MKVLRAVNDAKDFDTVFERTVEEEDLLETRHEKHAKSLKVRMSELWIRAHLRLSGKKRNSLKRRNEEAVTEFGVCFNRLIKSLSLKVLICLWTDDLTRFAQRVPVRWSFSSKRWCFSSQ